MTRSKWGNIPTYRDDIRFDSKKEAARYDELKILERAGKIQGIQLQPEFLIHEGFIDYDRKKHRPICYRADFRYYDLDKKVYVIEDVKGKRTDVYLIKKKMFLLILTKKNEMSDVKTIFKEV